MRGAAHANADANSHTHSYANCDADGDSNSYAYFDPETFTDAEIRANAQAACHAATAPLAIYSQFFRRGQSSWTLNFKSRQRKMCIRRSKGIAQGLLTTWPRSSTEPNSLRSSSSVVSSTKMTSPFQSCGPQRK